jgi:fructose 1,6-bisphosphate aldolase/phosphatase
MTKITISLIKADVGGYPGHSSVHRHKKGCDNGEVHTLAWETFEEATEVAKKLKLYAAGQDLLANAFSGNICGMGPSVAEMEINERTSEPLVAFMMEKTEPGAFNLPIIKIFADPFNTVGLVIDPACHHGFTFEVWDITVPSSRTDCPWWIWSTPLCPMS